MEKVILSRVIPVAAFMAVCSILPTTAAEKIKKEKLQIVFCF